jgi:predicted alpha/beta-hydrolase family hydrolase
VSNLKKTTGTGAGEELVQTPAGAARLDWFPAQGPPRAVALLGHGTATGVEAADLQALAAVLPRHGTTVALVTQPYRVEGNPGVADQASLDSVWKAVWPRGAGLGLPVISGGRSAGSQVACRTAAELGALAVLALAYPLLGPGSSRELLSTGRPTLIIQGGNDPFGRPGQFPPLPPHYELVEIRAANHMFATGAGAARPAPLEQLTGAATAWIDRQLPAVLPRDRPSLSVVERLGQAKVSAGGAGWGQALPLAGRVPMVGLATAAVVTKPTGPRRSCTTQWPAATPRSLMWAAG